MQKFHMQRLTIIATLILLVNFSQIKDSYIYYSTIEFGIGLNSIFQIEFQIEFQIKLQIEWN